MRDTDADIIDAIDNHPSYKFNMRVIVEPSRIYFTALTEDHGWASAQPAGLNALPDPQTVGYYATGDISVTFINDITNETTLEGSMVYMLEGDSSPVVMARSMVGNPSIVGSTLYYLDPSGNVHNCAIDWTMIAAKATNPFTTDTSVGTGGETPLAVHGISSTHCAILSDGNGGIRARIWTGGAIYAQVHRFMFLSAIDYTGGDTAKLITPQRAALYSGAAQLGDQVYVYLTNFYDGSVQAVAWDEGNLTFGDIFTAISTNLIDSFCEVRLSHAFLQEGMVYLVAQFHRTENAETEYVYSFILRSTDGRNFSIDRNVQVSSLGYRFHAVIGGGDLILSDCNRVCRAPLVYTFNGTALVGHAALSVGGEDILDFSDSNEQGGTLALAAGYETLPSNALLQTGARVRAYAGYQTEGGFKEVLYGTYIIEQIDGDRANGQRSFSCSLVNISEWHLSGLTSPYYVEFFSRSSIYDPAKEDGGNLYVAPDTDLYSSTLIVDFWGCQKYDDTALGITGIEANENGGLANYVASGAHYYGYRTRDFLSASLDLADYPVITATTVTANLRGWSHDNTAGAVNDTVKLILWVKDPKTKAVTVHASAGGRFPNSYPAHADGSYPLSQSVTGLTVGRQIIYVGVTWQADHATDFLMASIELNAGIEVAYSYSDANTGWERTPDKGLKLPMGCRPYIMFSQKPYDAWNFRIAGQFVMEKFAATPGVAGYPLGFGLVGLAEDGANYVAGRVEWRTKHVQIVKVVKGAETVLVDAAPSVAINDTFDILFEHRDGDLYVHLRDANGRWAQQASYAWLAADGWIFREPTSSKKTGIIGYKSAPWYKITGYDPSQAEPEIGAVNADGIPCLPGYDLSNFPATGKVRMGRSVFTYTGAVSYAAARGPYQYRQNGSYEPPFGDGWGLESLDFDWEHAPGDTTGKLLALDDGSSYLISGALWQIYITTDGQRVDLTNRSRQYSSNLHIDRMVHSLVSRVYITGGVTGISQVDGNEEYFAWGDICSFYVEGDVYCRWFHGSSGDGDTTIADLIEKVSAFSGAGATFPGDFTAASVVISGETAIAAVTYPEGLDLRFSTDQAWATGGGSFTFKVNVKDAAQADDTDLSLVVTQTAIEFASQPSATALDQLNYAPTAKPHDWRITFHDNFCTLYMDDRWIHTFSVEELVYPSTCTLKLAGSFTAYNVRITELSDWREAIYIDLESDAKSALGNIIQERPLEIYSRPDGRIAYWYDIIRDTVVQVNEPRNHRWSYIIPAEGASDALVYGMKDVKSLQYAPYALKYGFATRVLRLPNLATGMIKAARKTLQRVTESGEPHDLTIRPDVRLEAGDLLDLDYTAAATGVVVAVDVIVESVDLSFSVRGSAMTVRGRRAL